MIHICICQELSDTFLYNLNMERTFNNNKIKELRTEKGLSQRELARATQIKQANISRWEVGIVVPNILDVWKLADYFDVSIDYLVGKKDY